MSMSTTGACSTPSSTGDSIQTQQAQQTQSTSPEIPNEILLLAFHHLSVSDLCKRCSLVCKGWKALSERNELWQALAIRLKLRLLPLETCSPENQRLMYYDRPVGEFFPLFRKMYTESRAFVRDTFQARPFCRLAGPLALPENVQDLAEETDRLIRNHFMGEVGIIPPRSLDLLLKSPLNKAPQYVTILLTYLAQRNAFDLRGIAKLINALSTTIPQGPQQQSNLQFVTQLERCEKLYQQGNVQGYLQAFSDYIRGYPNHLPLIIASALQLCLSNRDTATANQLVKSLSPHYSLEAIIQSALMTSINTIENFKLLFLNYPNECINVLNSTLASNTFQVFSWLRNCFVMANEDALFFEILKRLPSSPQCKECLESLKLTAKVKGNKTLEDKITAHLIKIQKEEAELEELRKRREENEKRIAKLEL